MKRHRSAAVSLAMIPLLAASLTACGSDEGEETAYCVDNANKVVDDENCGDDRVGGGAGFFFLYAAGGFGRGQRIGSGTRIPSTDKAAVARRGGFGSSGSGGVGRSVSGSGSGGFSGGG